MDRCRDILYGLSIYRGKRDVVRGLAPLYIDGGRWSDTLFPRSLGGQENRLLLTTVYISNSSNMTYRSSVVVHWFLLLTTLNIWGGLEKPYHLVVWLFRSNISCSISDSKAD